MNQLFNTFLARTATPLLLCFCLFLAAACGKEGLPQPQDDSRTFSWETTSARITGQCLTFIGKLKGAYGNFNGIRLEVAQVNGPEDCPGCPFVPREILNFSPSQSGFDSDTGSITLTYCPKTAPAYRWRLIGMNAYVSLPHAVSPVKMTVVTD